MRIERTELAEVRVVSPERRADDRGWFARTFCAEAFAAHGLHAAFVQCSVSFNAAQGTLRGLHWQAAPYGEWKLVRCVRGAVFDVAADVRADSPTRGRWVARELSAANGIALCIPPGFAHGFQTLAPDAEVFYQMSAPYRPRSARVVRWDDPSIAVAWPIPDPILSPRDAAAEAVPW